MNSAMKRFVLVMYVRVRTAKWAVSHKCGCGFFYFEGARIYRNPLFKLLGTPLVSTVTLTLTASQKKLSKSLHTTHTINSDSESSESDFEINA